MTTAKTSTEHLIPAGETPFGYDPYLGRTLKQRQDFIGEKDFVSFDEVIAEIKSSGKTVVLNIGDSSTAGWDTRVTVENKQRKKNGDPLLSAFFRYPTYSDKLREQIGEDHIVLNAGIPGHTTINTLRRLNPLLERFSKQSVTVDYVSIYLGNNDCQWEYNAEDKSSLRTSRLMPVFLDRLKAKLRKPDTKHIRLRTNKNDFLHNIRRIVATCRNHGAAPMLIVPEIPIYWEPGKRFVDDQFPIDDSMPGGGMVLGALARSRELWQSGLDSRETQERIRTLEAALEMDFVVPRIKKTYRALLEKAARDMEVPLVKTVLPRETNDAEYFVDYCHPIDAANDAIAAQISAALDGYASGRYSKSASKVPLIYRLLDSPVIESIVSRFAGSIAKPTDEELENKDIYTLY